MDRRESMPIEIADLTRAIVAGMQDLLNYSVDHWKPEAGIVNFYQYKDSLTAHQDRSELNTEAPLLSFR